MVAFPLHTPYRGRHADTSSSPDIVEESKAIFRNNELIIRELDQICAYMAASYSTVDSAPWATQEFLHRYRFPVLFFALFFLAVIKLFFF
jgi:hypothetical protein